MRTLLGPPATRWFILLGLAAGGPRAAAMDLPSEDLIWFDRPAVYFTESSPIANGRLAAMVFGGTTDERIVLNESNCWSGSEWDGSRPADVYKELPEIRRLMFAGEMEAAEKRLVEKFTTRPVFAEKIVNTPNHAPGTGAVTQFGCFQVLANLWLNFDLPDRTTFKEYRRELDLSTAVAKVSFVSGGVRFTREAFVSAPADVIVVRLAADRPKAVSFRARLDRPERAKTVADGMDSLVLSGQLQNGTDGMGHRFAARVQAVARGGAVFTKDTALSVRGADEVLLFITGITNGKSFGGRWADDPAAATAVDLRTVAARDFGSLKQEHIADHSRYYRRSALRLGGGDAAVAARPTPERLLAQARGTKDPGLAALLFNFGRYALISTSRPGGLPPNLQGLWAEEIQTPWNGDWHLDVNLEMNYWSADICNLGDLNEPLFRLIEAAQGPGGRTARQYYNARGWVIHTFTNPWGFTAPGWSPGWGVFHGATAWLCQHVWDHYVFSRDRAYLERAYPILKGATQFYLDTLVEDPKTKWLVTVPSHSPENPYTMPNGYKASACIAPASDMQMLRQLFAGCVEAAKILGVDEAFRAEVAAARARLVPTRVAPDDGRLMEWFEDYQDVDPQHRHLMPLWGAYPGTEITVQSTPALVEAAKRTLAVRDAGDLPGRGNNGPGWGLVMRVGFWARFRDPAQCARILKLVLRPVEAGVTSQRDTAGAYPNLFLACPPFQIDANLASPAVIAEMLLQSHTGEIELLPALPAEWPEGAFERLCARGGLQVSAAWSGGRLTAATVRRTAGEAPCRVRYQGRTVDVAVARGAEVRLDGSLGVVSK